MVHTIIRSGYSFRRTPRNIRVPATPLRRGHIRHISGKTVRVSPHTVTNRGLSGKGPYTLPPMRPGRLYGWKAASPRTARHRALSTAIRRDTPESVFHRLQLLSSYLKRTAKPKTRKVLSANTAWVRRKF